MRSANLFGPLKGHCPYKALIGLTQASGLAGGFDKETVNRRNASTLPLCREDAWIDPTGML